MGSVCAWFTSFYVRAVMPVMLLKPIGIYPCSFVQNVNTLVLGKFIRACSSFVQCASTLVPQNSVRTIHHGMFFICLVRQYVSTLVLSKDNSSWLVHHFFSALIRQYLSTRYRQPMTACSSFVQCASTLVPQYLVRTTHDGLFFICLVRQNVRTVVLGRENSSRLVLHLLSAPARQCLSTSYRQLMTACSPFVQCARMLGPQYSVGKTHHGLLFICSVRQYVSTLVLGTDNP